MLKVGTLLILAAVVCVSMKRPGMAAAFGGTGIFLLVS
jgi:hypothetical protein